MSTDDVAHDDSPAGIIAQLAGYDAPRLAASPQARATALALSKKLSASLEDPEAYAMATALAPMSNLAVRIAIDIDLFALLAARPDPVSTADLAAAANCDAILAHRLLRTCRGLGLVRQEQTPPAAAAAATDDHALWSANALTRAMAAPAMAAWHRMLWDMSLTAAIAAPPLLRETGPRTLADPSRGILQRAFPSNDPDAPPRTPYQVLEGVPALHRDFNAAMAVGTGQPEPWFRLFPAAERLLPHDCGGSGGSAPLLVDVGGGHGHDLRAFHAAFPGHGPLVLQDLPHILAAAPEGGVPDPSRGVTAQPWDFFSGDPQPVRGARAYLLRRVLHQWPDGHALRILRALREAMREAGPDRRSTLLVCDAVLPDVDASRAQCEMDMCVMVFSFGLERSRAQWRALLTEAGFDVVKIWQTHPDTDGVIEAVVSSSE